MPSKSEIGPTYKPDKAEFIPTEKAIQKIEKHIKNVGLGAPRFRAFEDHVLLLASASLILSDSIRVHRRLEKGYAREYLAAERLIIELQNAILTEIKEGIGTKIWEEDETSFVNALINIRDRAIERKSQQPEISR
ncbi:MAG: hypothetical protein ACRD98_01835 [Nitrososphaera sp.]